ncbi:MAG: diacylglycerol kinase family lipid kinase [Chloroflexota bacterium]|nr:diacylglycerol kinase family lipid kinase [Chloroflexota bacterium]
MTAEVQRNERWGHIDARGLQQPAALVFNPRAGYKLGLDTNAGGEQDVEAALRAEGIAFDAWPTQRAGHGTVLARQAVAEGRELVIAAGGDGTVNEVARGLANTHTVLGLMPLGSIMNVARTLWIPRELAGAARTIAEGKVLAMDMGRTGDRFFLEAAGVGLDAGLFGYFERLERGGNPVHVFRAGIRFLRQLGRPRVMLEHDGGRLYTRAPMVSIANGPYVGAAYAIAPGARIDDGLLDVVVFRHLTIPRVLLHLALIAGGRSLPPPAQARTLRVKSLRVSKRRGRPLPVHVDGNPIGVTPVKFEVAPAALRVVVGPPEETGVRAWEVVGPVEAGG